MYYKRNVLNSKIVNYDHTPRLRVDAGNFAEPL